MRLYEIWIDGDVIDIVGALNEADAASKVVFDKWGLSIVESVTEGNQKVTLVDGEGEAVRTVALSVY